MSRIFNVFIAKYILLLVHYYTYIYTGSSFGYGDCVLVFIKQWVVYVERDCKNIQQKNFVDNFQL